MENMLYAPKVLGSQPLSSSEESTSAGKITNQDATESQDELEFYESEGRNKESERKSLPIMEPADESETSVERSFYLKKVIETFEERLKESLSNYLGFPGNQSCTHLTALSHLLKYLINNVGDPFDEGNHHVFNTKMFEVGVLDWCAELWEIEKNEFWGYVTSGGTEGNLYGLLLGRELLPDGVMYTSAESHYSLFKIARMYRIECETISTMPSGTTFKGAVENLDIIIQTLKDCGFSEDKFYIHCDAALLGFVVPFLNKVSRYTFKNKPIGSVSISGHKFLGSPMPCGVVLTRNKYREILSKNVEYIGTIDTTISGSRSGHAPIFLWYTMSLKGRNGVRKDVEACLENALYLKNRLRRAGISAMLNEGSITVVFERPKDDEFTRYWLLQCFKNTAHVVVMPHVSIEMLDRFMEDLIRKRKTWYENGRKNNKPPCLAEEIGVLNCACAIHS